MEAGVFSDHNGIKLENNNRKILGKFSNIWQFNDTFQNIPCVKGKTSKEIRNY
jgi:hypothetical protein